MIEIPPKKLNWVIRFGLWIDAHRSARRSEFEKLQEEVKGRLEAQDKKIGGGELQTLKIRLDRLELYVGLKREQAPVHVPGAARVS